MEIKVRLPTILCSRLPPGYLWRQFRRLRAQKDFPFVRVIDRAELEPAAQQQGASGRRFWSGGREVH